MDEDPRKERLRRMGHIFWGALMLGVLSVYTSSYFASLSMYVPRSETGRGFFEYYFGIMVHNPTHAFWAFMLYGGMLMVAVSVTGLIVISIMKLIRGAGES